MSTKKNHSSIEQFKEFVKKHPKLIQDVRKGQKEWQEIFEDWYLLGENDVMWKPYKVEEVKQQDTETEDSKKDFMTKVVSAVKNMDANQVNHHITNMSNTISTIQDLFQQFGSTKGTNQQPTGGNQPFSFRKD